MARWHSCNVLSVDANGRRLWQFDGGSFKLEREQATPPGQPLPPHVVAKSWSSLWRKKLNVAWLPPEQVFIRVAQFPQSAPDETRSMVELQLEKLSPIPVTQAAWSMQSVPHPDGKMQTVVLLIVTRSLVEEFLGRLEGEGYLADRLELPLLDQLQAIDAREDGAWIIPETSGTGKSAVVGWWYGGVLQNVDLLTLPVANEEAALREQLMQMFWAGELEGWVTSAPRWHLVADDATAERWLKPLRGGLDSSVDVLPPVPAQELAARTARRAADSDETSNLLPPEFVARYRQQFVDRLWMRGLGAVLALYVIGLLVYFVALAFINYKTTQVVTQQQNLSLTYTNTMRLQAQFNVLKQRQELKFAALDAWLAVAESLPADLTLDNMNFSGGEILRLNGSAPADEVAQVLDFTDRLRRSTTRDGKPLFQAGGDPPKTQVRGASVIWSYELALKRSGES